MGLPDSKRRPTGPGGSGREPAAARAADLIASEKTRWVRSCSRLGWRERSRALPALSRPMIGRATFLLVVINRCRSRLVPLGMAVHRLRVRIACHSSLPEPWVTVWKTSGRILRYQLTQIYPDSSFKWPARFTGRIEHLIRCRALFLSQCVRFSALIMGDTDGRHNRSP
jgi:hypothetical protein